MLAAPADGCYQLLGTPMELAMAPLALSAVKFKPEDLRIASIMGRTSIGPVVHKDIPANNVDELLAWAKGKRLSYASIGQGSLYHIMGEQFRAQSGLDLSHVPYKAATQIFTDLGGGAVDMSFTPLAGPLVGQIREGRFKLIGVSSPQPHRQFPEVAAISPYRMFPGFNFDIWVGIQVHRSTPETVVQRINRAMNEAVQVDSYKTGVAATGGMVPSSMTMAELDRFYYGEIERFRALFKAAKVEPQ